MFALGALHMVATSIFLDGAGTIRAVFGVGHKPVRRFCVVLALLIPLFNHVTCSWCMKFFFATRAERVSFCALRELLAGFWMNN